MLAFLCPNLSYVMKTDAGHGLALIKEILRQKNEQDAFKIYYFAQHNSINSKHKSWKELISPEVHDAQPVTRTATSIFSEIYGKMRNALRKNSRK